MLEEKTKYENELISILNKKIHDVTPSLCDETCLNLFDEIQLLDHEDEDSLITTNTFTHTHQSSSKHHHIPSQDITNLRLYVKELDCYRKCQTGLNICLLGYIIYELINFFCSTNIKL